MAVAQHAFDPAARVGGVGHHTEGYPSNTGYPTGAAPPIAASYVLAQFPASVRPILGHGGASAQSLGAGGTYTSI